VSLTALRNLDRSIRTSAVVYLLLVDRQKTGQVGADHCIVSAHRLVQQCVTRIGVVRCGTAFPKKYALTTLSNTRYVLDAHKRRRLAQTEHNAIRPPSLARSLWRIVPCAPVYSY